MDEESAAQNFMNVARRGNLSPRQIESGKLAGRGRKKQTKEIPSVQAVGVQIRRNISKSINYQ